MTETLLQDYDNVLEILSNEKILVFIVENLKRSLKSTGFSNKFIKDLISSLKTIDDNFFEKHEAELREIYALGFFQKIVPSYFSEYVIPLIPEANTILDLGCGTGILAHVLSNNDKFKKILGIDLNSYPEWKLFKNSKVKFKIVSEAEFPKIIKTERPEALTLTWTLHHMDFNSQERYLSYLHDALEKDTKIIILEDSYSTTLQPLKGLDTYRPFMAWDEGDRKNIMFVYCWIANRVLAKRKNVPTPSGFRSLEDWEITFKKLGYEIDTKLFIGFPEKRDINTPQSAMVISVA